MLLLLFGAASTATALHSSSAASPHSICNFGFATSSCRPAHSQRAVAPLLSLSEEPSSNNNKLGATAVLATITIMYGTNYPTIKYMNDMLDGAAETSVLRFGVAFMTLAPVLAVLCSRESRFVQPAFIRDGMQVGVCFALAYAAQATALETSNAGLQAFLCGLAVLVCPALESTIDGKEQPPKVWAAALLATAGIGCIELGGIAAGSGGLTTGDLIGLGQPLGFGTGFFLIERAMATHQLPASSLRGEDGEPSKTDFLTPLALTAWQFSIIFPLCLLWLAASGGAPAVEHLATVTGSLLADPTAQGNLLGALVWTGAATTALSCVAETAALGTLSSAEATIIFSTEPLWACVFAFAMLGESLDASCAAGGALMLSACLVSSWDGPFPGTRRLRVGLVKARRTVRRALAWA